MFTWYRRYHSMPRKRQIQVESRRRIQFLGERPVGHTCERFAWGVLQQPNTTIKE